MRNPPVGFKHSDPTHLQFGQSADSSLLAKRRQGFADGGGVEDLDPNSFSNIAKRQNLEDQSRLVDTQVAKTQAEADAQRWRNARSEAAPS